MLINNLIKIQNKLTNVIMQRWNMLKLMLFGSQILIGGNYRLIGSFYIRLRKTGKIILGDSLTISSGLCYNPITRNNKTAFICRR